MRGARMESAKPAWRPSLDLTIPKPGSQSVCARTQRNAAPRLAEALEISVDVIGSEALEGMSLLVKISEEALDVPLSVLPRCHSPFLPLALKEIFEPLIVVSGRRNWIMCRAAKPFQKAAGNGTEVLLRPARSIRPSLCHSSNCPRSGDSLELCSIEAILPGILLD